MEGLVKTKEGLSEEEAIKELECLHAWEAFYYRSFNNESQTRVQTQIKAHEQAYRLEHHVKNYINENYESHRL